MEDVLTEDKSRARDFLNFCIVILSGKPQFP
jgi:hypothetical protein